MTDSGRPAPRRASRRCRQLRDPEPLEAVPDALPRLRRGEADARRPGTSPREGSTAASPGAGSGPGPGGLGWASYG